MTTAKSNLSKLLSAHRRSFAALLPKEWQQAKPLWLDLTANNPVIASLTTPTDMAAYIEQQLQIHQAQLALGRYGEMRGIYQTELFQDPQGARCVHLGLDITLPAGTPIFSPLKGIIHSYADNAAAGDYGPTLIVMHTLEDQSFYILYGHLSRNDLLTWQVGQAINAGHTIGHIGAVDENGGWSPHLHLQIIQDLQGKQGDYPGVCRAAEAEFYLNNCPNPNVILGFGFPPARE
jgi:murein DD-endopeptidase MepM/ murein hydrolase activator NlpD